MPLRIYLGIVRSFHDVDRNILTQHLSNCKKFYKVKFGNKERCLRHPLFLLQEVLQYPRIALYPHARTLITAIEIRC